MTPAIFLELESADDAVACARLLKERGVATREAYTPYAVPELEAIVGTKRTRIPWAALVAGAFGGALALAIIWYCNAYDYPLDVGGRPVNSLPTDIPIMFETTVLFAALTTFVLLLLRSRLPYLSHSIFAVDGFERVSIDRYWLGLDEGADPTALEAVASQMHARVIRRTERVS